MLSKRRLKRIVLGGFVALVLATGLFLGVRAWRRSVLEREWAAAMAETEQTDPHWRWEALNAARVVVPPDHNGADLIPEIYRLTPHWGNKLLADEPDYDWPPTVNTRYPAHVIDEARRTLTTATAAISLARKLKDYPTGRREVTLAADVLNSSPHETRSTNTVVALLKWDVVLAVESGDREQAAESLLTMLNAARSIGDEPTSTSQCIRRNNRWMANWSLERALAQTEFDDARLGAIQAAWAADAEEPLLLYAMRGERAIMDRLFERLADGTIDLTKFFGDSRKTGRDKLEQDYDLWQYQNGIIKDRARALRWYTAAVAAARLPAEQQPAAFASIPPIPDGDPDLRLAGFHQQVLHSLLPYFWRNVAETRCAVVAVACERFRVRHQRWPADLAELPRDLLAAVPADPFDGMPLRYKMLPDGVLLSSVGSDNRDRGRVSRRPNDSGTAFGFRLWNPEHRCQPPSSPPDPEIKP